MALGFYFVNKGFTAEKYEATIKQLEEAGAGAPAGRIYHAALEQDGDIQVFDIWESQEALNDFAATLVPVLTGLGVELSEPMVSRVHNVIEGQPVRT
jgi:hypothetical protein